MHLALAGILIAVTIVQSRHWLHACDHAHSERRTFLGSSRTALFESVPGKHTGLQECCK